MISKWPTIRIGRCARWLLTPLFVATASAAFSEPTDANAELPVRDPRALVRVLQADSFRERQWAEDALRKSGGAARDALREGLESDDLQTRRTCRRLLDAVGGIDQAREREFLARGDEFMSADLPGWHALERIVGNDLAARKLYVAMLEAEPGLLASFALDRQSAATAMRLRCGQLLSRAGRANWQISRGSSAALLLVGADRDSRQSPTVTRVLQHILAQWLHEHRDPNLAPPPDNDPFMRMIGHFIAMERDESLIPRCFQLAVTLPVKNAALRLAITLIETNNDHRPETVTLAAGVAGWLGGERSLAFLVPLLDDSRTCHGRPGRNATGGLEVRDVAAAWIIRLSRQNADDYGIAYGDFFRRIAESREVQALGGRGSSLFPNGAARDACLAKLRQWLSENPPEAVSSTTPPIEHDDTSRQPDSTATLKTPESAADDEDDEDNKDDGSVFPLALADHFERSQLLAARDLAADGRFTEATSILGKILARREDSLYLVDTGLYHGLRHAAESTLASLPAAGLRAYEQRFGDEARRQLEAAVEARDSALLGDVQRRYYHTRAGAEAAFLLALLHMERNQSDRALSYLNRLARRDALEPALRESVWLFQVACDLRAGNEDLARKTLDDWRQRNPEALIEIEGRSVRLFSDEEPALARLKRAIGGVPGIAGSEEPGRGERARPTTTQEAVEPPRMLDIAGTEHPLLAQVLRQVVAARRTRKLATISTVDTLRIDDLLVQRVLTGLLAVDATTGDVAWRVPSENALNDALRHGSPADGQQVLGSITAGVSDRLWRDASWGTLTSDGQRVFALEDLAFDLSAHYQHLVTRLDGRREWSFGILPGPSLLSAFDARTGKILWQAGAAFGEIAPGFSGARLLGPPLPVGNRLFVLVRFADQTRLVQLDARDGTLVQQWPVTPVDPDALAGQNSLQRPPPVDVAPPVLGGDWIVSATARNQFIALDPRVGIVWSVQIDPEARAPIGSRNRRLGGDPAAAWMRAEAVVAGDRVLVTSPTDRHLHCLDLPTGRRLWQAPCDGGLLIASVVDDKVVIVGSSRVRCFNLGSGQSAWRSDQGILPEGAVPLHRGWIQGNHYLLPLTSAQFAVIELATGTVRLTAVQQLM